MAKSIRTENLSLPEEMIQHIQSFLSGKEAARTSILSKSWYTAWSTGPHLVFNQPGFYRNINPEDEDRFWDFVKKTLQRYEKSNLKVVSLRLFLITGSSSDMERMDHIWSLADELSSKAMKMGAVDFDFDFGYFYSSLPYWLSFRVLESETLIRLSVTGLDLVHWKVSCPGLRSLSLNQTYLGGNHNALRGGNHNALRDIISSCPLIENLTLSKLLSGWELVVDGQCNLHALHNLKSLLLADVEVDPLFFSEWLSNFACLKDLTLDNCRGYNCEGIKLCSRSLECIAFKQGRLLRADFDIPTMCIFKFSGSSWPSLSFSTAMRNWESHIDVKCQRPCTTWFLKLQKMLTSLRLSKIYLSLTVWSIVEKPKVSFQGLTKTAVENVTMLASPDARSVSLECLFQVCRPKLITLCLLPELGKWKLKKQPTHNFLKIVWNRSIQGVVGESCLVENKNMIALDNLEEVNLEVFEENGAEWQPLPCWQRFLDFSSTYNKNMRKENMPRIRFQLRWAVELVILE